MKKYLIKLADHLDKKGLYKEANYIDAILKKAEEEFHVDFDEEKGEGGYIDLTPPIDFSKELYDLSWGTVFDITVDGSNKVTSLKIELPNGRIATYTDKFQNGLPLANTVGDLNAKYNLGLVAASIKSKEEIIADFQDAIIRSENMPYEEMEETFNYFYKNYPQFDRDFVRLIDEYKREKYIEERKADELEKIKEFRKSPRYQVEKNRAVNSLYQAMKMVEDGDTEGAMEKVDYVLTVYPHHKDDLINMLAVLNRTKGNMVVKDMLEKGPTYTSIETEEFVPAGPGIPTTNIEKYLPQ